MVNSPGGGIFTKSPGVVDGYSGLFHDVFGGPLSSSATDGLDSSLSGWHTRSAVAGFDLPGGITIEPEMIFQIDPELAEAHVGRGNALFNSGPASARTLLVDEGAADDNSWPIAPKCFSGRVSVRPKMRKLPRSIPRGRRPCGTYQTTPPPRRE